MYVTVYMSVEFDYPCKSQLRMIYESMKNCRHTPLFGFLLLNILWKHQLSHSCHLPEKTYSY